MLKIYNEEIELLYSNDELGRTDRLNRIIGYVCCLSNGNVLEKIISLEDHKGILRVKSKSELFPLEKKMFYDAWGSIIGDGNSQGVEFQND